MRWNRGGQWQTFLSEDGRALVRPTVSFVPYEIPTFSSVDEILDRIERFWVANTLIARALAARAGRVVRPVAEEICALLEATGPLRPLRAYTHSNELGKLCPPRTFAVDEVMFDITYLAETWRAVSSRPKGREREKTADVLVEVGLPILQAEMDLLPHFRHGRFGYDIAPASLRALLWERLFRVFDRALRAVCKYCGEVFEPEPTPGRAYQYCPAHRTSACRQAVSMQRAPADRFPGRFDLTLGGMSDG